MLIVVNRLLIGVIGVNRLFLTLVMNVNDPRERGRAIGGELTLYETKV